MAYKFGVKLRNAEGKLPTYVWPGGYPVFYLTFDGGVLCPGCANGENGSEAARENLDPTYWEDRQWAIQAYDVNWEDPDLYCDHCQARIESAYAEDDRQA